MTTMKMKEFVPAMMIRMIMTTTMIMVKRTMMMMMNMAGDTNPATRMKMRTTKTMMKMIMMRKMEDKDSVAVIKPRDKAVLEGALAQGAGRIATMTGGVANLPVEEGAATVAEIPGTEVEIPEGAREAGVEDLLPWILNKGVKLPQWVDAHPVAETVAAAGTAAAGEAAEMVAVIPPMEDAAVHQAIAGVHLPEAVHKGAAAGEDLPQWILNNAGKLQLWADELLTAAAGAAVLGAATDAVAVPMEGAALPAMDGADHVSSSNR